MGNGQAYLQCYLAQGGSEGISAMKEPKDKLAGIPFHRQVNQSLRGDPKMEGQPAAHFQDQEGSFQP